MTAPDRYDKRLFKPCPHTRGCDCNTRALDELLAKWASPAEPADPPHRERIVLADRRGPVPAPPLPPSAGRLAELADHYPLGSLWRPTIFALTVAATLGAIFRLLAEGAPW